MDAVTRGTWLWTTPVTAGAMHRTGTTLHVAGIDRHGVDRTHVLGALVPGDVIHLAPQGTSGDYWVFTVKGAVVAAPGGVVDIPVTSGGHGPAPDPTEGSVIVGWLLAPHAAATVLTSAATLAEARTLWPDADTLPDPTLSDLLDTAWEACAAFLPADELAAAVDPWPRRWVQANVLHARDLWTAYRHEGGVIGFDSYAVTVRPLSATVRALLRPPRGVPGVA